MNIILWIIFGLIVGFIAAKIVNKEGEGFILDVIIGIVGSVLGGWLFETFGMPGITGFNIWSMFVGIVGAIVLLLIWHLIRGAAR